MPAADLIRLVERLGAPYGLERSVKIAPGVLLDDRCLISIHRSVLGKAPLDRLAAIGRELSVPPDFANAFASSMEGADIVHFGHEGGPGGEVRKIYFEYASEARRAMAAGSRAPVLVHLAYKWTPDHPESRAVTRYSLTPCRTRDEVESRLRALMPAEEAPRALRCALGLLSQVADLADSGRLFLMEVEEQGNPRRSCDLNVYAAELRLGAIADLIEAAMSDFAAPPARARALFGGAANQALGHLSAGVGRGGEEFVTIYYGVESH
jgi:tryptophan 7-halogenase